MKKKKIPRKEKWRWDEWEIRINVYMLLICCCSVAESHPTLCDSMDCSMPGLPVALYLLEFAQVHVHPLSQ